MIVTRDDIRAWVAEALTTQGDVLTTEQASQFLGVSPRTLWNWLPPRGDLPCYELGGNRRFLKSDLLAYVQAHRVTATAAGGAA